MAVTSHEASGPSRRAVSKLSRALIAPGLTVLALYLLRERWAALDLDGVGGEIAGFGPLQWVGGVALALLSYLALGRFDALCHRILRSPVPRHPARRAGMAAIALSQTLGLGLLTGALARWRLLPGLGLGRSLAIATFMGLAFMLVWGWLALGALSLVPDETPGFAALAGLAFVALPTGITLLFAPLGSGVAHLRQRLFSLRLTPRVLARLTAYACIDMLAAACIVFLFLSPEAGLGFFDLLPAFLIALGLGLISGTPGGIGAFELTLVALLPGADPALLLAAVTGYRVVYFALPACAALVLLARPRLLFVHQTGESRSEWRRPMRFGAFCPDLTREMFEAPRAEAQLARQPGMGLMWSTSLGCGGVIGSAGKSLVLVRDPFPPGLEDAVLDGLVSLARERSQTPALYKASARLAVLARRRGWQVLAISREAWIDPETYDPGTRARRQLRRKLRHAEQAGLELTCAHGTELPLAEMEVVSVAWARAHGGERGFSMGRFHADLVAPQRVFLARKDGALVGFVTFHQTRGEWCLDLMRALPDAPDGTIHALIDLALHKARDQALPRLSLAAVPLDAPECPAPSPRDRARTALRKITGGAGLTRFKTMFDPQWDTLYLAAPSTLALGRSGVEIARAIAKPVPMDSSE